MLIAQTFSTVEGIFSKHGFCLKKELMCCHINRKKIKHGGQLDKTLSRLFNNRTSETYVLHVIYEPGC